MTSPATDTHRQPTFRDLADPLRLDLLDAQTLGTSIILHIYKPSP